MNNFFKGAFYFDPKEKIFENHFKEAPVVPGSMIIGCFLQEIKKIKDSSIPDLKVKNFSFLKFIPPGIYKFKIIFKKNHVICELYKNGEIVSKGKVIINNGK